MPMATPPGAVSGAGDTGHSRVRSGVRRRRPLYRGRAGVGRGGGAFDAPPAAPFIPSRFPPRALCVTKFGRSMEARQGAHVCAELPAERAWVFFRVRRQRGRSKSLGSWSRNVQWK